MDEVKSNVVAAIKKQIRGGILLADDTVTELQSEGPQWLQFRVKSPKFHGVRYFEVKIAERY